MNGIKHIHVVQNMNAYLIMKNKTILSIKVFIRDIFKRLWIIILGESVNDDHKNIFNYCNIQIFKNGLQAME